MLPIGDFHERNFTNRQDATLVDKIGGRHYYIATSVCSLHGQLEPDGLEPIEASRMDQDI